MIVRALETTPLYCRTTSFRRTGLGDRLPSARRDATRSQCSRKILKEQADPLKATAGAAKGDSNTQTECRSRHQNEDVFRMTLPMTILGQIPSHNPRPQHPAAHHTCRQPNRHCNDHIHTSYRDQTNRPRSYGASVCSHTCWAAQQMRNCKRTQHQRLAQLQSRASQPMSPKGRYGTESCQKNLPHYRNRHYNDADSQVGRHQNGLSMNRTRLSQTCQYS
jgi:hypothetical protein